MNLKKLNIKQRSLLSCFLDIVDETDTKRVNQLCRLTLSSKLNTGEIFPSIIESFMDSKPEQIRTNVKKLKKELTFS